jgi:MFS family permease
MWPVYILGLSWIIPNTPAKDYLTLQLRSLSFTVSQTNLLTIPAYIGFIISCLFWPWLSERVKQRLLIGLAFQAWYIVFLVASVALPTGASHWVRWALSTLLIGAPYLHPILVAITSRNAGSVQTRTVASALYNMMCQVSNIISANVYRENDKPIYRVGNETLIAVAAYNMLAFFFAKVYYLWRNR